MAKTMLKRGDVFQVKVGHNISVQIQQKYVFANRPTGHPNANKLTDCVVTVGQSTEGSEKFDTTVLFGEYVVINVANGSNGYQVTAKKLEVSKWNPEGTEINFYQSKEGYQEHNYTNQIDEEIPVIKKMTMSFH